MQKHLLNYRVALISLLLMNPFGSAFGEQEENAVSQFNKVDEHAQDGFGSTLLHHAVKKSNETFVNFLIQNRANITLKNNNGETPLHLAAQAFIDSADNEAKRNRAYSVLKLLINELPSLWNIGIAPYQWRIFSRDVSYDLFSSTALLKQNGYEEEASNLMSGMIATKDVQKWIGAAVFMGIGFVVKSRKWLFLRERFKKQPSTFSGLVSEYC